MQKYIVIFELPLKDKNLHGKFSCLKISYDLSANILFSKTPSWKRNFAEETFFVFVIYLHFLHYIQTRSNFFLEMFVICV